jgi:uncharacterized protein YfaS (alpha-2-macroglobulin family)
LIQGHLPGGFEALNEGLNTTTHEILDGFSAYDYYGYSYEEGCFWEQVGYNKEIRPDWVSFFVTTLPSGVHYFNYYVRVTSSGEFVAMPAEVSAMYDARFWGRSDSAEIVVGSR